MRMLACTRTPNPISMLASTRTDSFRNALKEETVRACLPLLREDMLEQAVKVYEDMYERKYGVVELRKLLRELKVVAFRLGDADDPSARTQVHS